jgi:hypothetical protein
MTDPVVINQSRFQDRITIGSSSKGGQISISFDSADLAEAERRVDVAVRIRARLLEKLGGAL